MLSSDNLCKQIVPSPGPTCCRAWTGYKLFDTMIVFLKDFFGKKNERKNQQTTTKARKITQPKYVKNMFSKLTKVLFRHFIDKKKHVLLCSISN